MKNLIFNTKFIGKNYIYFDEIDSTNLFAKRVKDLEDGTVILAESQTSGRGRNNRKWISPKNKGLYFSIILKPDIENKDLSKLSLIFPIAVRDTLQKYISSQVFIKWPNDIYINNKKISGFLFETDIENNKISRIIAGIGININHSKDDLKDVQDIATSLKILQNKEFDRKEILNEILQKIEELYLGFDKYKDKLHRIVSENLLWKGEKIVIIENDKIIEEGILLNINQDGFATILTKKGIKYIYSGDLSIRKGEK